MLRDEVESANLDAVEGVRVVLGDPVGAVRQDSAAGAVSLALRSGWRRCALQILGAPADPPPMEAARRRPATLRPNRPGPATSVHAGAAPSSPPFGPRAARPIVPLAMAKVARTWAAQGRR